MPERFRVLCAVYVVRESEGKVLLARRFNTGYQDGNYSLPSGHIDGQEKATIAAVREAKEEAGVEIDPADLQFAKVIHRNSLDEREYIDFYFKATKWLGKPTIAEPDKCDDLQWFALDALPENIIPDVKQALLTMDAEDKYLELGW